MSQSRFVGIDLAWSDRNRTGLAVVDVDGRLLDSATVRTDAEIVGWVGDQGEVLVAAVDAPLIVPNAAGQRPGENEVQRSFGAYGAGPYPANRSRPWFDPPRGETLARAMGWSMDPARHGAPGEPVCIEVYPHPAMVALFELPTVLPYKSSRGRTPEARRDTFTTLVEHMETIEPLRLAENVRWLHLRAAVEGATRHMHLEAVEDEIDAVLCAHLAWLWHTSPDVLQVYGTFAEGYVVAPPPPTHAAGPRRARPVTPSVVLDVAPHGDLMQNAATAVEAAHLPEARSVTIELAVAPGLGPRLEVLVTEVLTGMRDALVPREVADIRARFDARVDGVRVTVAPRRGAPR
ncbi:DUF429 domain-containing protein [Aeromicrobium sp. IC_218]|uniref:DUF429 domain-containing protein n=1 Tax=Aeromicrobium sp. IC_218 TaxID=2545468 RepID=UPI0013F45CC9|nr:DUF429 domain-containing protein [Aeromicrobium sp. IC_218]